MISDKEKQLRDSLTNKEYREALAEEHVNTTLAIQIRKMREDHRWSQSDLAGRLGKHQETISQWEDPDYGRHNITTLKKLAAIFDVALLVKFMPFSELIEDMVNLSDNRLSPPSYTEEQNYALTSVSAASQSMRGIYLSAANEGAFTGIMASSPLNATGMTVISGKACHQDPFLNEPDVKESVKEVALVT